MAKRSDWQEIKPLGEGGQSHVFLVRTPARRAEREASLIKIQQHAGGCRLEGAAELADAAWNYSRPEASSELGALKVFKIKPDDEVVPSRPGSLEFEPIQRLKNEIAALSRGLPGLPKLLDSNEADRWIVTEYFPDGSLKQNATKFKGNAIGAMLAFRSLVETVSLLHREGNVHRDVKPANVFLKSDRELILGDFGIVFVPNGQNRVTLGDERVGPRDYMPPWTHLGTRHEDVHPRDDVYMLGKLLWCMVAGRHVLPREYHRDPDYEFDLTRMFPSDPHMQLINAILDKCVVERPDQCLTGALDLLLYVDDALNILKRGGQLLRGNVARGCKVCGKGFYQPISLRENPLNGTLGLRFWVIGRGEVGTMPVRPFACDYCGHIDMFSPPH